MTDHRPRLALLLTFLVLTLLVLRFGPVSEFIALNSDGAVYLLMADHFSAHLPGSALTDYVQRVSQFPPLFPLLIAWSGGASDRLAVAHLLQSLSLLAAFAVHTRLAIRLTGHRASGFLLLACLTALPMSWLLHAGLWSEFTYLALAGGALLLAPRRDAPVALAWLCALLCALACATRSAGVTLGAAFAVALLRHAPRRAWPALLLLALPSLLQSALHGGGRSAYLSLFTARTGGVTALAHTVAGNLQALWHGWQLQFALQPTRVTALLAGLLLALAAIGLAPRLRALTMDALYLTFTLLLLLVWPFPDVMDRLQYPLVPLVLIHATLGAQALVRGRWTAPQAAAANALPLMLALLCAAPASLALAQRFQAAPPAFLTWRASREWLQAPDLASARTDVNFKRTLIALMRQSTALMGPDDCLYTVQPGPAMFFVRRVSFPAPLGAARPASPVCHYQLLLGDTSIEAARRDLWQPNETVLSVRDAGEEAGVLVRYPAGG